MQFPVRPISVILLFMLACEFQDFYRDQNHGLCTHSKQFLAIPEKLRDGNSSRIVDSRRKTQCLGVDPVQSFHDTSHAFDTQFLSAA
jgi:hypothetical protein